MILILLGFAQTYHNAGATPSPFMVMPREGIRSSARRSPPVAGGKKPGLHMTGRAWLWGNFAVRQAV